MLDGMGEGRGAAMLAAGALAPLPGVDLPEAPHGRRLWVYDCEVFPNAFLAVFSDGREWRSFTDRELPQLARFVADPALALAGFNNHAYDDLLLRHIVAHPKAIAAELHRLSLRIIDPQNDEDEQANTTLQYGDTPWAYSIDVFQLLNGHGSLKEWCCREGFPSVVECPAPFDQSLADDQLEEVARYCRNDVYAAMLLLARRWHLVRLRTTVAERFDLGDRVYTLSEPQLAQHTFLTLHRRRTGQAVRQVKVAAQTNPDNLSGAHGLDLLISRRVAFATEPFQRLLAGLKAGRLVGEREGLAWSLHVPEVDLAHPLPLAGTAFALGIGGLHSVDEPGIFTEDAEMALIDLDVTSYYPAIIITEGLFPRQLGPEFVVDLARLRDQRVAAKRSGDKATADALKIVINSIYGKLNDHYSPLRSAVDAHRVTLNGQLLLLMLIERLHQAGARILSANTDGVTAQWRRAEAERELPDLVSDWQARTGMELERTDYQRLCRRDVNSYVALDAHGKVKAKGAFTSESGKGDGIAIKRAAVAHLLHGTDPAAAIDAESEPTAFLFYQRAKNGGELWHGEERLGGIARWYATRDGEPIRRRNPDGSWAIIPHGHAARLALDVSGWTRAALAGLDRRHYVDEAWKLIREVQPASAAQQSLF
jgi:hypothetical protein